MIELLFGRESHEYLFAINELPKILEIFVNDNIIIDDFVPHYDNLKEKLKQNSLQAWNNFIESCIETLEVKGIYKTPKENLLTLLARFEIITLIIAIFLGGTVVGGLMIQYKIDKEKIQMENKIDSLNKAIGVKHSEIQNLNGQMKKDSLGNSVVKPK